MRIKGQVDNPLKFVDLDGHKSRGLDFSWAGFLLRYSKDMCLANSLEDRWNDVMIENDKKESKAAHT
ncbi:hypothetical protein [Brevibacillus parabrevis]|jgi:hypothetical protein|uniref:Uncharacterized protein n=1 Tax=Brevibacillus parabrevis TaxID=54914 RepID=A0A4Y3PDZ4_BREPA|nr:hypothetical protein [Brevibacillus parabrevis]WDV97054.1 hypothetical protein PSE45_08875 [Brevibacillus parabrevis]GEB31694.1 hypothetical protein BPA01_12740 [Brevibacillus parabrevis]